MNRQAQLLIAFGMVVSAAAVSAASAASDDTVVHQFSCLSGILRSGRSFNNTSEDMSASGKVIVRDAKIAGRHGALLFTPKMSYFVQEPTKPAVRISESRRLPPEMCGNPVESKKRQTRFHDVAEIRLPNGKETVFVELSRWENHSLRNSEKWYHRAFLRDDGEMVKDPKTGKWARKFRTYYTRMIKPCVHSVEETLIPARKVVAVDTVTPESQAVMNEAIQSWAERLGRSIPDLLKLEAGEGGDKDRLESMRKDSLEVLTELRACRRRLSDPAVATALENANQAISEALRATGLLPVNLSPASPEQGDVEAAPAN